MTPKHLLAMSSLALMLVACQPTGTTPPPPDTSKTDVKDVATDVLVALEDKDVKALADLIDPTRGVRFTPYSHVSLTEDVVLKRADLEALAPYGARALDSAVEICDDPPHVATTPAEQAVICKTHHWGSYDGSGEPMDISFGEYFERFIYNYNYASAPEVNWNQKVERGNSIDNAAEMYPDAEIVEYHFDGFDPQYGGMDWGSLRLVFEKVGTDWYLVGIIHDQWTI